MALFSRADLSKSKYIVSIVAKIKKGTKIKVSDGKSYLFKKTKDIDDLETLFTKLGSIWCDITQLDSETLISNTSVLSPENWDLNCGFGLILREDNGSFGVRVVHTSGSCVVGFIKV